MENNKSKKNVFIFCGLLIVICLTLGFIINKSDKPIYNHEKGEDNFHTYKVNEVLDIYVSLEEVSTKYLSDLVTMVNYFPKELYEKLDDNTKEKYGTYQEFEYAINRLKTLDFLDAKVKSYTNSVIDNKSAIYVIDKAGNNFVFIEDSINYYKIRIM